MNDERATSQTPRQGTLPERELETLLSEIRRGTPWRSALEQLALPYLSTKRQWFTNVHKARFYLGLVSSRESALDIGAGSGVIAAGFAAGGFRRAVALEQDPGWCNFMRLRYQQDGLSQVEVVQGSAVPRLPFPDGSFDLVAVNGVLEWIPEGSQANSPREAQLTFLREVRRVLRPGGSIGVAIENRLYLRNFLGDTPHNEPPFVVIMPRWIGSAVTRIVQGKPYRTWIYSYWGYQRLLRDAGFNNVSVQQMLPSYHTPEQVVAVTDARATRTSFGAPRGLRGTLMRALTSSGLLGYLSHSFCIGARV